MNSQQKLQQAMSFALANRPAVGGFPFLAECLRAAGVVRNIWTLPAVQSVYIMTDATIVQQGIPLVTGMAEVPPFYVDDLVAALRRDQSGAGTFPEFLQAAWQAGVVTYEVDFTARVVVYRGVQGEEYTEAYQAIENLLDGQSFEWVT